eukprot:TRINITY_DN44524_c0_g1_i1.p1 TRINITY_DN44524_c0_g1~~TRINITY_DN44524_c0_g1_i1.p1  ORF type:complete len:517 (-),score=63.21 TRINITY_DN44524_c0_g1_i1:176-1726(-)
MMFLRLLGFCLASLDTWADEVFDAAVKVVPCRGTDQEAGVFLVWPQQGQKLAPTLSRVILRTQTFGFDLPRDGLIRAVISGTEEASTGELVVFSGLASDVHNIEIAGLPEGKIRVQLWLVDPSGDTKSCWYTHSSTFTIEASHAFNRSQALRMNIRQYEHGFKGKASSPNPFLVQPLSTKDFAYVTVLWSDDFVDNAIVWAEGLRATGCTFRRICMVARGRVKKSRIRILTRCCCHVILTEPIQSPEYSTKGVWSRYEFVLTKLRVLQLDKQGLRKVVLMDADTLVLQNIDELFWLPAPAATVNKDTLMGELEKPKLSAGMMVLEPNSQEFEKLIDGLQDLENRTSKENLLMFIEQELLDVHYNYRYHVIPLSYNLYPELLDIMPFLHHSRDHIQNSSVSDPLRLPLDSSIKVVHMWHLYNPAMTNDNEQLNVLQLHAKLVYKQMWRWYILFWELHQLGLERGAPEDYPGWKKRCNDAAIDLAYGSEHAARFVPALGNGRDGYQTALCRHIWGIGY